MKFDDGENVKRFVLIVEDELINREILGNMLNDDYHVLYAVNGIEALEVLREHQTMVSVVLLDLMMPEMDGFEVIDAMHKNDILKHIPIIVLTSEKDAEVKTLQLGAADFIKKPYNMPEVIKARIARTIELFERRNFIEATEKDELTDLYTKTYFYKYAEMIDKYHAELKTDAVILNIEHFHLVNEIYGRQFGDKVLITIANTIKQFLSDTEGLACRSEGDTFYIYMAHQTSFDTLINKIQEELSSLSQSLHVRLRAGVYSKVPHDLSMEERFSNANFACNTLRGNYMRYVAYYDISLREHSLFEEHMVSDIHEGLEAKQFLLLYQPKYDISLDEPSLSEIEVFVRWNHPVYGMLKSESFLKVFEQNGLINMLDHYVIKEALNQLAEWKQALGLNIPISVNISRIGLYSTRFADFLKECLTSHDLTPKDLVLEITESAYSTDSEQLIEAIGRLQRLGYKIEMIDFGSGYSSLNLLTSMPIDVLRLDETFVHAVHEDDKTLKLVHLIAEIADYLGVPISAEGVEMATQYDILKDMGCRQMQGNYFTKPLEADELVQYLRDMQ